MQNSCHGNDCNHEEAQMCPKVCMAMFLVIGDQVFPFYYVYSYIDESLHNRRSLSNFDFINFYYNNYFIFH